MKRIVLLPLLCLFGFSGCEDRVPSNYDLASIAEVEVYDSSFTESEFVGTVDVSPIAIILAQADWTSKDFIRKGSWKIRTDSGREIILSYYGSFFLVDGVPGSFVVKEEDETEYRAFLSKLSKIVIKSRQN